MTRIRFKIKFNVQNLLVKTIESLDDYQFQYILEDLKIGPNQKAKCFGNLSIFEKVLMTPESRKLIILCLQNGSDFYRVSFCLFFVFHKFNSP